MKNPLIKRLPRELKGDIGKYIVIFLFMTLSIGFISGFLVAGGSMKTAYDNSFEKYNIEDGHFVTSKKLSDDMINELEKEDVTLYPDFYIDKETIGKDGADNKNTLRIYKNRTDVNKICLMDGAFPKNDNEIVIDRMYADNNDLEVGDEIKVGEDDYTISGLVAFSDYSALFSDPTDLMFDALKFSVAAVTDNAFDHLFGKLHYSYEWKYEKEPKDEIKEKELSDDFMETLYKKTVVKEINIDTYLPRYSNQAIQFTGDDIGGDRAMMIVLLYILIIIMAFIFAVTTSHTIVKEAGVIGTLRASGYTKMELLRHYMAMPLIVSIISSIIGNILGYTVFKYVVVMMYYGSYSLPTYVTIWNGQAFLLTTVVPFIIMFVINICVIWHKLSLSPLKFLRHDLSKRQKKKAVRLPKFKFMNRFRIRVILQNKASYIILFIGMAVANVLLLFGLMMTPLLDSYQDEIIDNMICKYQYILTNNEITVNNKQAESFQITNLKYKNDYNDGEQLSLYGIENDSKYFKQKIGEDGFYVSDGLLQKYRLKVGDTITLTELYGKETYKIKIDGSVDYPASLSVFMSKKQFEKTFKDADYSKGYFSNEKLDIDEKSIATCIEKDDLTKTSRQLTRSMGKIFYLLHVFSIILFALIIYLLTKLIIEKNSTSISMVKILGYRNREISKLYMTSTTWVVIFSILTTMFLATEIIQYLYQMMMVEYSGWLTLRILPEVYVKMAALGMITYAIVACLQYRKIKKVPMNEALKNIE